MNTTPKQPAKKASATPAAKTKASTSKPVKPAKAAKAAQPAKAAKPMKAAKPAAKKKMAAPKKPKLVRDSYTLSKAEHAALVELKEHSAKLGHKAKKGELLRAGLQALSKLGDTALLEALRALPPLKPAKPVKEAVEKNAKAKPAAPAASSEADKPAA